MNRTISTMLHSLRFVLLSIVVLLLPRARLGAQAPVISKVDPPNWWIQMPDPQLLVRGEHLAGSKFELKGTSASLKTTHVSANGHWAFLDLLIRDATPGEFTIVARNADGQASFPFRLSARRPIAERPKGFSSKDVMYLIVPDRFADGDPSNDDQPGMRHNRADPHGWHGGDIRGVEHHIDYMQNMGITAVWMTPVCQNHEPTSYHGYGATDLYAVDEHFGSLQDLQSLSKTLHAHGMKLVLDIVPNHVGPAHPWADDSPTPDWFHGTKQHHRESKGNFPVLMELNPSGRERADVLDGWFVDLLPDMNQENPLVSKYLIQNTIWWIEESGADGLRLDTFPYVDRPFWHDFHSTLYSLYPHLTTVGEVFNDEIALPPVVNSYFAGGVARSGRYAAIDTGLYTPFDYPLYAALRNAVLHDAPMTEISDILSQDSLYPHPERLVTLIGSHDTTRFLGVEGANTEKLKLAFALLTTLRGMPVIYYGDEIAMTGANDPDNRRDFPGGFDSASAPHTNAFQSSGRTPGQAQMYTWVKQLLSIRSSSPDLQEGELQVLERDRDTIAFVRGSSLADGCSGGRERILILANKAPVPKSVRIEMGATSLDGCKSAQPLLGEASVQVTGGGMQLSLPAIGVLIFRMR